MAVVTEEDLKQMTNAQKAYINRNGFGVVFVEMSSDTPITDIEKEQAETIVSQLLEMGSDEIEQLSGGPHPRPLKPRGSWS